MTGETGGPAGGGGVLEYYRTIVELGTAELHHHRTRFFENVRINLAVLAAIAVLMSVDVGANNRILFISVLIIFGLISCYQWLRQTRESIAKLGKWRSVAARIEESQQFRDELGGLEIKAWSEPDSTGETAEGGPAETNDRRHIWIASFWLAFYALMAVVLYFEILASRVSRM